MRDALSIMDKIVSFTNGSVSYHNTLEHLNILDADYYFKLIDCMLQQDLAGGLLLYDDINRKGFEGDLVINGFAEFIRNLLVCKDEKVASLLEVVDSFREKYVSTAKKLSIAYLVSALNVLNETEINYKAARNKRLHVELALIKLSYLQQALELSSNDQGLSKKKLVDTAKPVAFRNIPLIELKQNKTPEKKTTTETDKKNVAQEPKLVIETKQVVEKTNTAAKSIVKETVEPPVVKEATTKKISSKIGALQNIRDKFANTANGTVENKIPLTIEKLQEAWS